MPTPKLPKDKEHLVLDNLNMVHWVLHKKMGLSVGHPNYEDYFQEGCIGLILSAIRFDESRGFKFSTFAFPNIMGSIQRYKRDCEPAISISRNLKDVLFKVIRYSNQGYTLSEIEQVTGIKSSDISDALNASCIQSIHQPVVIGKDESTSTVEDMIASQSDYIEEMLNEDHILETIQRVSDSIDNETHRGMWEEYIYSLFYGEKLSQQYFADKYGSSQAQISRILRKYKQKFTKLLQEDM